MKIGISNMYLEDKNVSCFFNMIAVRCCYRLVWLGPEKYFFEIFCPIFKFGVGCNVNL